MQLVGFGTFSPVKRAARTGKNPPGAAIKIPHPRCPSSYRCEVQGRGGPQRLPSARPKGGRGKPPDRSASRPAPWPLAVFCQPLSSTPSTHGGSTMTAFSDAFRAKFCAWRAKEIKGRTGQPAQDRHGAALRDRSAQAGCEGPGVTGERDTQGGSVRRLGQGTGPGRRSPGTPDVVLRPVQAGRWRLSGEQLGLSQQAMASLLEASTLSVARWEGGKAMPRAKQLERIQVVLKMGSGRRWPSCRSEAF